MLLFHKFFLKRRLIALYLLLAYGCGSPVHMAPVSVNPTQSYHLQKEASGVVVAVDPYMEGDRLKQHFGANLIQKKLLPVLFVIENREEKDGVMVESSQIMVMLRDKTATAATDQASVKVPATGKTLQGAISVLGYSGVFLPVAGMAGIALLPFLLAAEHQRDTALKINDNLTKKGLVDRTLYPGETASGFVYFPLSKPEQVSDVAGFVVKVKNLKTNQVAEVILPAR